MKNTILIISASLFVIFSGCSKSNPSTKYSCQCVVGWGGGVSGTAFKDTTFIYSYGAIPQATAQSECDSQNRMMQLSYGVSSASNGYNGAACNLQ